MLGRKLLMAGEASVTDFFNGLDGLSTFSRNLAASGYDKDGVLQTVPANVPVIESANWNGTSWDATGLTPSYMIPVKSKANAAKYGSSFKGYLNEPARTNVYFPSAAPVTKTLTTTAQVYTISLRGIGSAVLSGTATGTVTTWGGPLTFTATTGTLTITVSGVLTHCQIEAGAFATSPIVTTTAAITRPATNLTRPTAGVLPVNDFGIWGRIVINQQFVSNGFVFSAYYDANNTWRLYFGNSTELWFQKNVEGVSSTIAAPCAWSVGTVVEFIAYQSASLGRGLKCRVNGGAWTSFVELSTAAAKTAISLPSSYQIGATVNAAHLTSNFPFLAIIAHADPKGELIRLADLYPT